MIGNGGPLCPRANGAKETQRHSEMKTASTGIEILKRPRNPANHPALCAPVDKLVITIVFT
jgi:hypothetical protein